MKPLLPAALFVTTLFLAGCGDSGGGGTPGDTDELPQDTSLQDDGAAQLDTTIQTVTASDISCDSQDEEIVCLTIDDGEMLRYTDGITIGYNTTNGATKLEVVVGESTRVSLGFSAMTPGTYYLGWGWNFASVKGVDGTIYSCGSDACTNFQSFVVVERYQEDGGFVSGTFDVTLCDTMRSYTDGFTSCLESNYLVHVVGQFNAVREDASVLE